MKKKIIFIFIDGFGVSEKKEFNPLNKFKILDRISNSTYSLDPVMEVKGIPQSATGQTSLFCGVNAQKLKGSHGPAFPDRFLRKIIKENNLFSSLKKLGVNPLFVNAYTSDYLRKENCRRSVTTWQVLYSESIFLTERELSSGKAVYHDITNLSYNEKYKINIIAPIDAAKNLLNLSSENDFVLFEYFITDRVGHRRMDIDFLSELEDFLSYIIDNIYEDTGLIITSDHGNVEDMSRKSHTKNRVPLYLKNMCENDVPDNLSGIKNYILDHYV